MADGAFLLLVLLIGLLAPLALYALVRDERERDRETVAGWDDAERSARKDDADADGHRDRTDRDDEDAVAGNSWDRRG